jgi:primosomal protein N' (replication factor Y)
MAALVVSAADRASAETHARALARAALAMPGVAGPLSHGDGAIVLGPAEAPIAVVRGRHRFRLLVKTPRGFDLQRFLRDWLAAAPKPTGSLRVAVDVDPQSFL